MGARAVVLDFTMDEQSTDRGQDALLREAIAQLRIPVALGYAVNVPSQNGEPLAGGDAARNWTVEHRAPRARADSPRTRSRRRREPRPRPHRSWWRACWPSRCSPRGRSRTWRWTCPEPRGPCATPCRRSGRCSTSCPRSGSSTRSRIQTGSCAAPDSPIRTEPIATSRLAVALAADLLGADALVLSPGEAAARSAHPRRSTRDGSAALDYAGTLGQRFDARSLLAVVDDSVRRERGEPPHLGPDFFRGRWCSSPASRWAPST